jgi:hypothetical protein
MRDIVDPGRAGMPTRAGALLFSAKVMVLRAKRAARETAFSAPRRHPTADALLDAPVLAESTAPLWSGAESELEAGKVHNLRIAAHALNGVEVPAGEVVSFWAQVGRTTRRKGFVAGHELREGCLIPSIGGGICQLSNALYDAALGAGFEIVERHPHTRVVPGSLAEIDRDATVFWNYVDLRFRSARGFRIEALLTAEHLVVRIRGHRTATRDVAHPRTTRALPTSPSPGDCATCDAGDCFREASRAVAGTRGRTAFLLDEYWPEHDAYVTTMRGERDVLRIPLDGRRYGKSNYAWTASGWAEVAQAPLAAVRRAVGSRRLAAQGAERQRTLLGYDERLALELARLLAYDTTHAVVMQNLLPFLWREGHLGGRTFDVLMTRLPLAYLHERLDAAASTHAESGTLADFRADEQLVRGEEEALRAARRIVTPHAEIARLFGDRAEVLGWRIPPPGPAPRRGPLIVFPGPTLGRKGAYLVRSAALELDLRIAVAGPLLEGEDFWRGVRHERRDFGGDWLDGGAAVVAPNYVEHRPRRLLEAVARGVPVIASAACGLGALPGVTEIATGDYTALRDALAGVDVFDAARTG